MSTITEDLIAALENYRTQLEDLCGDLHLLIIDLDKLSQVTAREKIGKPEGYINRFITHSQREAAARLSALEAICIQVSEQIRAVKKQAGGAR